MKLSDITKKIKSKAPRIMLYAGEGFGKTTWASNAPNAIMIPAEDGTASLAGKDVACFPVAQSLDDVFGAIGSLITEDHEYSSVVVDSVTMVENFIFDAVCREHSVDSIETLGYGKGYQFAMKHWEKFISGLEKLRNEKGMAIILIAHSTIKTFSPPHSDPYDRFFIKLHKHSATRLSEWVDILLFGEFEIYTHGDKDKKQAVNSEAKRIIHTQPRPAWFAKSRYNGLPETIGVDFKELLDGIKA